MGITAQVETTPIKVNPKGETAFVRYCNYLIAKAIEKGTCAIYFTFWEQKKVLGYLIEEIYTGPEINLRLVRGEETWHLESVGKVQEF